MSPAPTCTCKKSPDGLTLHTGRCMVFGAQPYRLIAPEPIPGMALAVGNDEGGLDPVPMIDGQRMSEGERWQPESYFDVVRSMTDDPEVLAAVDRTEAEVRENNGVYEMRPGTWERES